MASTVSLKDKKGFTIVELLIVIVVIGILATLVIVTFTGIQQKGRNSQRQTDIGAIASHLAKYYAEEGSYPTLAQMQDTAADGFLKTDMKGLPIDALDDPKAAKGTGLKGSPSATEYGYEPAPASCAPKTATPCESFTLTGWLEGKSDTDKAYTKTSE